MFEAVINDLLKGDALAQPRIERRLRLLLLDTATVAIAALPVPLLVELQRQRAHLDGGRVRFPGMACGLSTTASAAVLTSAACWEERVGGDARSHGRPALGVVPAVLAIAHADGGNLAMALRSLLLGYEVAARLGRAYQVPPGEHVDGTWQTVGAAVAAAALMTMDAKTIAEAAAMATCVMTRSLFDPVREGRTGRLLYAAVAVERGMTLASAACAGFKGVSQPANATALTPLLQGPPMEEESPVAIFDAYVKFDPGARHTHYAAAATRKWLSRYGPWHQNAEGDATICLRIYPEAIRYCGQRAPLNRIQAQFSLVFAVAATLLHGSLVSEIYDESRLVEPQLKDLMERIQLEPDPGPGGRWAELQVSSKGGPIRLQHVHGIDGDLRDAEEEERLVEDRRRLLVPVLGEKDAGALIQHWWSGPLTAPVVPAAIATSWAENLGTPITRD